MGIHGRLYEAQKESHCGAKVGEIDKLNCKIQSERLKESYITFKLKRVRIREIKAVYSIV